ncbi:hypothetical protein ACFO4E_16295 [Nocardiopsis mangrovi]|uniref:Uncharacterized protein n=1 Tax=Nocardiopsis mangrovi TaxID=1179818 RepID=A0ABV9DXA4_9ACTN
MPKGNEGDIPLEQDEGLGEKDPENPDLSAHPVPTELHHIINSISDKGMGDPYAPMMSAGDVLKADWFQSFKSDQKSPDGLTHWLESHLGPTEPTWVPNPAGGPMGGSFVGGSDAKTYYSGIAIGTFFNEDDGQSFFKHLATNLGGPWAGKDSNTFSPTRMVELEAVLEDVVALANRSADDAGDWVTSAGDALKGATGDIFVEHLRNLHARFDHLATQVAPYPGALQEARHTILSGGIILNAAATHWLKTPRGIPLKAIDDWFERNRTIATIEPGDKTTWIGFLGKANNPDTWKFIQELIKKEWTDNLNDNFAAIASETMQVVDSHYRDVGGELTAITDAEGLMPLDWSGGSGGGGGFGPDDDDESEDNDKSDTQKEYEELLEDYYKNEIENLNDLMNDDDGDGEGSDNDDDGGPSDSQKEYEEALDKYYQDLLKDLESGPESSEDDLTEDGGGGNNDGPDMEDEYNNALDDYYQNSINDLNSGPEGGGGDLDEDGGGNGGDGPASEDRFNRTLDDYYNRQSDDLESEMNSGPPPPVGGGGSLGGGGGGNNNRRSSEERYNRQLDEYYDQAARDLDRDLDSGPNGGGGSLGGDGGGEPPTAEEYERRLNEYYEEQSGGLDRLMAESPDPDGDGRNDDGQALTPAEQEYQQALDEYSKNQREDLEQLRSGPEGGGGDLGGGGDAAEYEQHVQEYADQEKANLDRLRDDVNGITDENGNPAPELEEYRQQLNDYYDQRSQELDDLVSGPDSGGGDLGGSGGDGSSADEYQDRLNEYYDQQAADLEERMNSGPEGGGGDLGGSGGDGSSADDYQDRLNEYYDRQTADLEERMNAGPDGGGLGDSLGRDNGGDQEGSPPPSYSIGNGWDSPGSSEDPNAAGDQPDANGITGGGGDLRSNPPADEPDTFTGGVDNGNGNGQGGGNFSGLGGGMGGMGGGMPPMMPPMGGMGGGMGGGAGQGENARTRAAWMSEDERVWGTSAGERISVLGRPGADGNTKGSPDEYVPGGDRAGARTSTGGPGEAHTGKRKPGLGNRRGRLQGSGDQREDQR